ncbi:hypothetical protein B1222_07130 [Paenibacillus larvae subsp. pulvifaciens]|nr:hypothetical protein B1222_07130 [Paenibacillus larvae subsp. pulvifaciens]AQZ46192.1 hypothetical protein B5S25_05710 [Paenibacillus larvae subsp. pulvifaciens]
MKTKSSDKLPGQVSNKTGGGRQGEEEDGKCHNRIYSSCLIFANSHFRFGYAVRKSGKLAKAPGCRTFFDRRDDCRKGTASG